MEKQEFFGKQVLITGGTKGIGREVALDFLLNGARVFLIYSKDEDAKNLFFNEIKKNHPEYLNNLFFYRGNICDIDFAKFVFDDINRKYKSLDILINNAGINADNLFLEMTQEEWEKVLNVNIKGTYIFIMLFRNLLMRGENSKIVNVSSISGIYGKAGQVNYSVSKGCIIGMTRYFANKYIKDSIRVNSVAPGLIDTDFTKNLDKDRMNEFLDLISMKRMGLAKEIKDVIMFLASDKSNYINGKTISSDGGFLI